MTASIDELPIAASQAWSRLRNETRRSLGDDLTALWGYGGTIFPDRSRRLCDLDTFAVVERVPDERTKYKLEQAEAEIAREHGIYWDIWYVQTLPLPGGMSPSRPVQWRVQYPPPWPRQNGSCAPTDLLGRVRLAVRRGFPIPLLTNSRAGRQERRMRSRTISASRLRTTLGVATSCCAIPTATAFASGRPDPFRGRRAGSRSMRLHASFRRRGNRVTWWR